MMTDAEFMQWDKAIRDLDRYENIDDTMIFKEMLKYAEDKIDERVIRTLLWTFCNDDDYGIQERVSTTLNNADFKLYVRCLAEMFPEIQKRSSEQEWPLLLLCAIMNSNDTDLIMEMVSAARSASNRDDALSMWNFIHDEDYFGYDNPEIKSYLDS